MSERPEILFCVLIGAAVLVTSLLVAGLAGLGGMGVAMLSATLIGALTACVVFVAELGQVPVGSLVIVAFALSSALGFIRTTFAYAREQRLLRALPLEPADAQLAGLARRAGAERLFLTPARLPAAFCFGLTRPRIVLTSGLLERLTPTEQAAVVWHEARHARVYEPLRCLIGRVAAGTFFWIPALEDLLDRYLLSKELVADHAAIEQTSRQALAGALHGVIVQPSPSGAIGAADYADARIDRLLDPTSSLPPLFTRLNATVSILALALLGIAMAFSTSVSLAERTQMEPMLTTMSLHGLPGMALGLAVNLTLTACLVLGVRRYVRAR